MSTMYRKVTGAGSRTLSNAVRYSLQVSKYNFFSPDVFRDQISKHDRGWCKTSF